MTSKRTTRPRQSGSRVSGKQLVRFRTDVAKLKQRGLVGPKVDARKQKPTRYMREQVRRFADVLSGKARVVKVPRKIAKEYEGTLRVKRSRVVVRVENKSETVRYDKRLGKVTTRRQSYGKNIRKVIIPNPTGNPDNLPQGSQYRYTIPFANGGRFTFPTLAELKRFMEGYGTYKQWGRYVEVETVGGGDAIDPDANDPDFDDGEEMAA